MGGARVNTNGNSLFSSPQTTTTTLIATSVTTRPSADERRHHRWWLPPEASPTGTKLPQSFPFRVSSPYETWATSSLTWPTKSIVGDATSFPSFARGTLGTIPWLATSSPSIHGSRNDTITFRSKLWLVGDIVVCAYVPLSSLCSLL